MDENLTGKEGQFELLQSVPEDAPEVIETYETLDEAMDDLFLRIKLSMITSLNAGPMYLWDGMVAKSGEDSTYVWLSPLAVESTKVTEKGEYKLFNMPQAVFGEGFTSLKIATPEYEAASKVYRDKVWNGPIHGEYASLSEAMSEVRYLTDKYVANEEHIQFRLSKDGEDVCMIDIMMS